MLSTNPCLHTEVALPYPLYQSQLGHYFIGETPRLTAQDTHAIAALANPSCSNVMIYLNAITVTNTSSDPFSAEIILKTQITQPLVSTSVSCVNLSVHPEPIPKGKIQYLPTISAPPAGGVTLFSRIVSPLSTLVIDGGQIILPPGDALIIYLGGYLPVVPNSAIVALGWWEEPIYTDCY
ncbi:MAG: DUF6143 family protein [Cellulosilyticaceae bacterium]